MLGRLCNESVQFTVSHCFCPMFEQRLLLDVVGLMLLALVHVARWLVRGLGLLECVLGFTGGRLCQMRTMSHGRCGCALLPWLALGTMVGILCVVGVDVDCEGE